MITLTTPAAVNTVLGGSATVGYDKFVLASITYDTVAMSLRANIRITSTAAPDMQAITGTMQVNCATAVLTIEVSQLDFFRQVRLTGPQNDSVQTQIRNAQNALENGLVSLAVIAGTQATGA